MLRSSLQSVIDEIMKRAGVLEPRRRRRKELGSGLEQHRISIALCRAGLLT